MNAPREIDMLHQLVVQLTELLSVPVEAIDISFVEAPHADALLTVLGQIFVVEVQLNSSPVRVRDAGRRLLSYARSVSDTAVPLLVVPYMGGAGRRVCGAEGVSWLDRSGNANIEAGMIRVIVQGMPNSFVSVGRPSSVFAPKSARVVRWLLTHREESLSQRAIAQETDVSEGLVSKVVSRLETERFIQRDDDGLIHLTTPSLLLEAWREEYRFGKQNIVKGHFGARSGEALTGLIGNLLRGSSHEHAATGLSAAWQLTRFAAFRTSTFYADAYAVATLEKAGFRREEKGANLWLVEPYDSGVFQGAENVDGVRCVHPVQVVLDLDGHPERSAEAAENIRENILKW